MGDFLVTPAKLIADNIVLSSDAQTWVQKLPLTNFLHTLYVKCKMTNGATSAKNQSMEDVVDRIEVVANGTDVLFSLTPQEIKRWCLEQTGINIPQTRTEVGAAVQEATYPIMFGRMPLDPEYFLRCAGLQDLELRVTYSPTIAATSFATGTFTVTVAGLYSTGMEPGPYRGTICTKAVKALTSAASGDDQTIMPRGNLLRKVLVYAYEAATEDGNNITRVKLDLDNDNIRLVDVAWNDLADVNRFNNFIEHTESIRIFCADGDAIDTKVSKIRSVNVSENFDHVLATDEIYFRRPKTVAGDRVTISGSYVDVTAGSEDITADATGRNAFLRAVGEGLSHAVVIDLSLGGESALLNTGKYEQTRVTLTQGNAGADVRISAQEVRVL